jgi:hypothetical protein
MVLQRRRPAGSFVGRRHDARKPARRRRYEKKSFAIVVVVTDPLAKEKSCEKSGLAARGG